MTTINYIKCDRCGADQPDSEDRSEWVAVRAQKAFRYVSPPRDLCPSCGAAFEAFMTRARDTACDDEGCPHHGTEHVCRQGLSDIFERLHIEHMTREWFSGPKPNVDGYLDVLKKRLSRTTVLKEEKA